MKKSFLLVLLLSFTMLIVAQQKPPVKPQTTKPVEQTPSGKFVGQLFGDYFYVLKEKPQLPDSAKSRSGRNAFDVRRAHFGYEHTFNKDFSARITYDAAINSLPEAYVNWENVFSLHSLMIGTMQTSAEKTSEKYFGYRSLGALVLNRKEYSQEFDKGISLKGKFDPQGNIYYSLAVGNGSGTAPELDKIKKFYFTFGMMPDKASVLELYADFENFSAGRSAITAKLLYAMMMQKFSFGAEAFYRLNRKFAGTKDVVPAGASLFGWFEMTKTLRSVARVDVIDEDLNNSGPTLTNLSRSPSYREVYVNVGVDYLPIAEVRLIPNIIYVKQLKKGTSPEISDFIMARLTTAIYFK